MNDKSKARRTKRNNDKTTLTKKKEKKRCKKKRKNHRKRNTATRLRRDVDNMNMPPVDGAKLVLNNDIMDTKQTGIVVPKWWNCGVKVENMRCEKGGSVVRKK
jgi:hypothetical protein